MSSQEGPSTAPEQPATSNGIGGAGPNGEAQQGNGVLPNSSSTVEKFPLINRLFRRRNRVHNAYEAQSEFMQKFGHGGSDASAAAATTATATEPRPPPEGSAWKRFLQTWTIDASQDRYYYWTVVVSLAFIYNLLFVIARQVFVDLIGPTGVPVCRSTTSAYQNVTAECTDDQLMNMQVMPLIELYPDMGWSRWWWTRLLWATLDLVMDSIYWLDIFVRTRTGFLEQGLVVRDIDKIKKQYFESKQFKYDIISIIPLDYVLGWPWPFQWFRPFPIVRLNRLLRIDRVQDCMERTETRSSMPNAFRVLCVVWYIIVIIHWNACFYFWISEMIGLGSDGWVYGALNRQSLPENVKDTLLRRYIYSFYWSTLILTTIGEVPSPVQNVEYLFVTLDLMCGVLIFATIVGNVGSMISNMSAARTEFQNKMDGIKQYMELRRVSKQLEMRVIKWFDYLWANKQSLSDQQVLRVLPDKLQAEIAMQVHFETLRKVRIFQDCEAGLLAELVLKLQLQVFSPGDYICRKGDIGREMYIVKRGKLQVVGDDGQKVFATLQEGAVFGELSILNIAGSKNGNRRTANVRSVGYTDLFVLNKNDLWNALREYPDARKLLLAKGRELLKKDNLLDENAPEEQQTVEELAEQLNNSVKVLQTRMARLIAEHTSTETKLNSRIEFLEKQLHRYKTMVRKHKSLQVQSMSQDDG
ncbi:hypothetical protein V3C99_001386 [Haemonchus contortus]|uniref:Ion transport and Cyclic nucleotide-binding domain containing protein n=2 Tax=Haemonchus contortus TaxID=6289 RepID=A0A7I4YCJ7_HAECO